MVGLSIVLETRESGGASSKTPQVISKLTMMMINNKPTSPPGCSSSRNHSSRCSLPAPAFLDQCFLCGQKLLCGKDIYMYKCRQIFMDEEETLRQENCSFAAMNPARASASAKSTSSTTDSRHRKSTRNREGGFAC
ncbi:FCS-LIKE ZINC FINGER 5 [Salix purpurea]|uniref:FCS-LIKE ZINC FINGER 5 n=1 Tax=Salix purpurea TaxID=77065 RepID=A0A9Q0TXZ4_SALPP|nr:FCS-LIKE ZINC FINGER 5 [Salix purpurea]